MRLRGPLLCRRRRGARLPAPQAGYGDLMAAQIIEESFWIDSTPATAYPRLSGDLSVDTVVIGGGIAGLSAAWEIAQTHRTVAVVEAGRIAGGVTGYTSAKLSALHGLQYARLASSAGKEAARLYARSQQDAITRLERTADTLEIDCELERVPAYTYAEEQSAVLGDVRAEAEAAADAGLPAGFVTDTGLPFPILGAVRVADQAQFHPRRYLLGVAEAIAAAGSLIFERSRVVGLHEGDPCRVTTDTGATITARDVVVATHYPIFDRALLFPRLVPTRELVVAAAIPEADDPGGAYLTPEDGSRSVRTAPYRPGRRLLIATGEKFSPGAGGVTARFDRLTSWVTDRFPRAEPVYRWAAQDNTTSDHLPFIGPLHLGARRTYVATGFDSWGMASGVLSGRLIAGWITGDKPPWADLYDPRRLHPVREAGALITAQAKVAGHFVGDRLRRGPAQTVAGIAPGHGAVVRVGGERCAVYRDAGGTARAVSATCTHLGCLVAFNDAEHVWECPCHGSRFAVDGAVLHGPATRDLEPRELPE